MAGQEESLGTAVLKLTVDDAALRTGIADAKKLIGQELGQAFSGKASGGRGRSGTDDRIQATRIISRRLGDELQKLANRGVNVTRQFKQLNAAITAAEKGQTEAARARNKGLQGRISSGLIGGAFPLLFGQGVGAAVGGGLGGLAGGSKFGFGLSLVGTILGQTFDVAISKAATLARALDDPISNFDALTQNASLSSKAIEKYIAALIKTGRLEEASAVIRSDLLSTFGSQQGVESYNKAVDELTRSFSSATTILASFVAGPLADLIKQISEPTKGVGVGVRFEQLVGQLTPEQSGRVSAVKDRATREAQRQRGTPTFLAPINADVEAGLKAGIAEAEKLLGVATQRKAAEKAIANAANRYKEVQKINLEIGTQELNNNKLAALEARKRLLVLQKEADLNTLSSTAPAAEKEAINYKFSLESFKIEKEITREVQRRQLLQQKLASAATAFGESNAAATFKEVYINVSSTLREFGPASLEFKLALQEGANALLDSAKASAERFRDATRSLRDLQLGNLRFLPAKQRQDLIRKEIEKARPEARARGVALRGLEDVFSFNRFREQELTARQEVSDAQRNLADANDSLKGEIVTQTGALNTLTERLSQLIDKSWSVYVEVPGQNAAGALNMANQLN